MWAELLAIKYRHFYKGNAILAFLVWNKVAGSNPVVADIFQNAFMSWSRNGKWEKIWKKVRKCGKKVKKWKIGTLWFFRTNVNFLNCDFFWKMPNFIWNSNFSEICDLFGQIRILFEIAEFSDKCEFCGKILMFCFNFFWCYWYKIFVVIDIFVETGRFDASNFMPPIWCFRFGAADLKPRKLLDASISCCQFDAILSSNFRQAFFIINL